MFAEFCLMFNYLLKKPVFEWAFAQPMIIFFHTWLKTVWITSL